MNFKSNPKRKPGKNRPASSRRLIQGPQLRDFTKESLKFFQGTSKLIVLAELWGCPIDSDDLLSKSEMHPNRGTTRGCCGSTDSGIVALRSGSEIFPRKTGADAKKKNPPPDRPVSDLHAEGSATADSSEPAPSPRPRIFASGATPARIGITLPLPLHCNQAAR